MPFAIRDARSGEVVGSTRFLELRFEHLRVEIGWTWLRRSSWSTGINVETKLLLLAHAFEHAGCAGSSSRPTRATSARAAR